MPVPDVDPHPGHDDADPLAALAGSGQRVPCLDGADRPAIELDQAASTQAHPDVVARVEAFLPWYSSVHRGAGFRSRHATAAYEEARRAILAFAGRHPDGPDVAIMCRNTTEAINHLAYRLRLSASDTVVTTVVEHHANLLPWGRVATRRYIECTPEGTFTLDDVCAALDHRGPRPALLAVTGASNVTGWLPPLDGIIEAAHERGVPVLVDAAQLAPHRPLPPAADYLAFSGHKLYAPFGCGALIGPRTLFETGDPFLAGGGAVDLVGLDEVIWTAPPDREEAGSPNVIGAVALHAAIDALGRIGWEAIIAHDEALARRLSRRPAGHRRGPPPRSLRRARARSASRGRSGADPAGGRIHHRRDAPCPGGGAAQRRVRDRRASRLFLRPPLRGPPARPGRHRGRRLPQRSAGGRSSPRPRGGPCQCRNRDVR